MAQSYRSSFSVLVVGLGVVLQSLAACGDRTTLRPQFGSGGRIPVPVPGTGGDEQSSAPWSSGGNTEQSAVGVGGTVVGTGGAASGTGGAGTGGAVFGTGGAGTGGAVFGTGGAGTGGAVFGTGGRPAGTGGARSATGGAGGGVTLASGGAGGGTIGVCRYPSCLWNLIKDCLVTGQCTEESNASADIQSKLCCNNGVTETVSETKQISGSLSGTVTVTKGGEACYTVTFNGQFTSANDMNATYAWTDPSGHIAVKGAQSNQGFVTLTCPNGETAQLDTDCSPDGSDDAIKTPGSCE